MISSYSRIYDGTIFSIDHRPLNIHYFFVLKGVPWYNIFYRPSSSEYALFLDVKRYRMVPYFLQIIVLWISMISSNKRVYNGTIFSIDHRPLKSHYFFVWAWQIELHIMYLIPALTLSKWYRKPASHTHLSLRRSNYMFNGIIAARKSRKFSQMTDCGVGL